MKIEMLLQSSEDNKLHDISEIISNIDYYTFLEDQPGKLTFELLKKDSIKVTEGSIVSLKIDEVNVFLGYIFIRKNGGKDILKITAYDQMRYLKNKDTIVISNMTSSQVFEKVCSSYSLKYKIIDKSNYTLPSKVHEDKTLYEIIQYGLDQTLINNNNWYMIRDNFGVLEHVSIKSLITDIVIGESSLLNGYNHESSIDSDTYNQIKITQDNKSTAKREVYIVKDSETIRKYGLLQYYKSVDENLNPVQIEAMADMIIKAKNKPTQKLNLDCIGDLRLKAGNSITIDIQDLGDAQLAIIDTCKHSIRGNIHTMSLDIKVV